MITPTVLGSYAYPAVVQPKPGIIQYILPKMINTTIQWSINGHFNAFYGGIFHFWGYGDVTWWSWQFSVGLTVKFSEEQTTLWVVWSPIELIMFSLFNFQRWPGERSIEEGTSISYLHFTRASIHTVLWRSGAEEILCYEWNYERPGYHQVIPHKSRNELLCQNPSGYWFSILCPWLYENLLAVWHSCTNHVFSNT